MGSKVKVEPHSPTGISAMLLLLSKRLNTQCCCGKDPIPGPCLPAEIAGSTRTWPPLPSTFQVSNECLLYLELYLAAREVEMWFLAVQLLQHWKVLRRKWEWMWILSTTMQQVQRKFMLEKYMGVRF